MAPNFYELDSWCSKHFTESYDMKLKKSIERETLKELEMAAPGLIFVPYNPHPISSCQKDMNSAAEIMIQLNEMDINAAMTRLVWGKFQHPQDELEQAQTKPGGTTGISQSEDDIQETFAKMSKPAETKPAETKPVGTTKISQGKDDIRKTFPKLIVPKHPLSTVIPAMSKMLSERR